MKTYYRVSEVANMLKVSAHSVRDYANQGRLGYDLTPSGQRVFTQKHVDDFLGVAPEERIVFYTRSSNGNKVLLETQKVLLTEAFGVPEYVYSDNGSGLNENRKNLKRLLEDAKNGKMTTVCVTNKDRLTRFGYTYLETLLTNLGVTIQVMDETQKTKTLQEELLQDFMSLLASFSGKFYRLRGTEQKRQLLDKAGEELDNKTNDQ